MSATLAPHRALHLSRRSRTRCSRARLCTSDRWQARSSFQGSVSPPFPHRERRASGFSRYFHSRITDVCSLGVVIVRFVEEWFGQKKNAQISELQAKIQELEERLAIANEEITVLKTPPEPTEEEN